MSKYSATSVNNCSDFYFIPHNEIISRIIQIHSSRETQQKTHLYAFYCNSRFYFPSQNTLLSFITQLLNEVKIIKIIYEISISSAITIAKTDLKALILVIGTQNTSSILSKTSGETVAHKCSSMYKNVFTVLRFPNYILKIY